MTDVFAPAFSLDGYSGYGRDMGECGPPGDTGYFALTNAEKLSIPPPHQFREIGCRDIALIRQMVVEELERLENDYNDKQLEECVVALQISLALRQRCSTLLGQEIADVYRKQLSMAAQGEMRSMVEDMFPAGHYARTLVG